jgi:tetratricopeptide (TPR) repeat protein
MGFAHFKLNDFTQAKDELLEAKETFEKNFSDKKEYKKDYIFILRYLGLTLVNQGDHEEGINFYTKSNVVENKYCEDNPKY